MAYRQLDYLNILPEDSHSQLFLLMSLILLFCSKETSVRVESLAILTRQVSLDEVRTFLLKLVLIKYKNRIKNYFWMLGDSIS
jgi:hypothetical protein